MPAVNLYASCWTIIQACCEAVVVAQLVGDRTIANLAAAAALGAADQLGIPEPELRRIQQLMASSLERSHGHLFVNDHACRRTRREPLRKTVGRGSHRTRRAVPGRVD
jgi:hypothetical protein